MVEQKLYFNWSSGKDSALALFILLQDVRFKVDLLVTTINLPQDRISMHGVRRELLLNQFKCIGLPYKIIGLPEALTMEAYSSIMDIEHRVLQNNQYKFTGFGDILLEDVKQFREKQLAFFNIESIFPLWQKNTFEVAHQFIDKGFKAIIVSINSTLLNKEFCGRFFDQNFINDLPPGVDPCGENGEFHTFCFDGPIFNNPVPYTRGEIIYKEYASPKKPGNTAKPAQAGTIGFWFSDLLPALL